MHRLVISMMIAVLLGGCAAIPGYGDDSRYWWYVRYRIAPSPDGSVNWPVDLLISDQIIAPVLERHRGKIQLWRFHRRTVDDETGHQFSFIFYADKNTAIKIYRSLKQDDLTRVLLHKEILRQFITDDISGNMRNDVRYTSDDRWPETLQENWPAYIMGVSELWLGLIKDHNVNPSTDIHKLLAEYTQVNKEIISLWHAENRHALLHHLHAVFGYPAEKQHPSGKK